MTIYLNKRNPTPVKTVFILKWGPAHLEFFLDGRPLSANVVTDGFTELWVELMTAPQDGQQGAYNIGSNLG